LRQKGKRRSGKALFLAIVGNWSPNAQIVGQNVMSGGQKDLLVKIKKVEVVPEVVQCVLVVVKLKLWRQF